MIFVACFTKDTPYEEEVKKLRTSLERFGLPFDIQPYESRGSWLANCHYIPIFVRRMMDKYPRENIVYLDADAEVKRYPDLLDQIDLRKEYDFAVHHLPRTPEIRRGGKVIQRGWNELLDGTMYLRNTPALRDLVDRWIAADAIALSKVPPGVDPPPSAWEQKILEIMLPKEKGKFTWTELPAEYCYIFDNKTQKEMLREDPVIVHGQASRRFKKVLPSLLSTETYLLKLPQPFAIVGNGVGHRDGDGAKIDEYPTVIRMNNFVLDMDYVEQVGRRMTAWCVNGCGDVPYREFGVPVFTPFGRSDLYPVKDWSKTCRHLMVAEANWGKKAKDLVETGQPSTGLVLMHLLESLGIEATAFGFDAFQTGHYWDPDPPEKTPTHGKGVEAEIYERFQRVRMYER